MRLDSIRLGFLATALCSVAACSGSNPRSQPAPDEPELTQDASALGTDGDPDQTAPAAGDPGAPLGTDAQVRASGDAGAQGDAAGTSGAAAIGDAAVNGAAGSHSNTGPFEGEGTPFLGTVPRATCAAGDQADGMIQALSGDFRCNLQVAGQVEAPHFLSLAWHNDCAYVNGPDGTTVIHVAADGTPTVTTTLTELGFRSNWESMKVNAKSGLLAGYESNGTTLTIYDVSADCKAPALQSSTKLEVGLLGSAGHAGSFSPDGTIYYASSMFTSDVFAVDLAMPKTPKVITTTFDRSAHDLYVAKDGNRGYFANPDLTALGIGRFAVMDLSQIQARAPNAKGSLIHEISWQDGSISQYPILITYRGRDYLMITDELGSGNCDDPLKPQWGYARIFDMADEKNPKLVSLIKTEAQDPKNCVAAGEATGGTDGFGIGTHYCNVDRLDDPRLLTCGEWDAGVRVFDIRNPWRPKEVAYFDTPTANVPGLTRVVADKRELWVAVTPGTFYVLKFPAGSVVDQILSQ
jgi:hypothetical protein